MIPLPLAVVKWMKEEMKWLFIVRLSDKIVPNLASHWAA